MPDPIPTSLASGTLFHRRYRVVRCIKAGGMGAVYEVTDEKTQARRALKVMLPSLVEDRDLRARFALEATVTGALDSDHLVRVSDADVDEATGTPFLVMDLLRGEDLGAMVKQRGPLPPIEVVVYLQHAARALEKTHAAGIVHRDLKPENLFVARRDDGSPCVKILDFGIAKVVAQSADAGSTAQLGTPMYMAPEQIRGEGTIGPRADLYALGHIAYTLLVGEPYWKEERRRTVPAAGIFVALLAGAREPPAARAARLRGVPLPPAFDAWFLRATALAPERRASRARPPRWPRWRTRSGCRSRRTRPRRRPPVRCTRSRGSPRARAVPSPSRRPARERGARPGRSTATRRRRPPRRARSGSAAPPSWSSRGSRRCW